MDDRLKTSLTLAYGACKLSSIALINMIDRNLTLSR